MTVSDADYPTFYRKFAMPKFRKRVSLVEGIENLPKNGPYIIVANHVGSFDPPMIISVLNPVLKKLIYFVSEQYIVDLFGLRRASMRLGMIPKIEDRKADCLEQARDLLLQGKIVGIFPEGIRNDGPVLHKGRTGAARLALWTRAPILPIGYKGPGTWSIRQAARLWFKGLTPPAEIRIGKPISFPEDYDKPITYELLREVTKKILQAIAPLAQKPYPY